MRATPSLAFASVLLGTVAAFSVPADAACKKFGFTVNDYGKEGPTNDAKNLLDKHISEWATKNGVSEYSTGKKTVSCELFLDVILFDEHTCTASATVCWGPDAKKLGSQSAAAPADDSDAGPHGTPPAPVRKAEALGTATQQAAAPAGADAVAAEADVSADAPATDTAAVEAAPTTPVEQIAAPADVPAAAPAVHTPPPAPSQAAAAPAAPATTGAVVETGALQAGQNFAPQDQRRAPAVLPEPDRAAAAAAAASAAAAAERAAQAAETAANAAKEAAAAAVAASAASKRGATVPPLNQAHAE